MREIKFRAWDEQKNIIHKDVEFIRSGNKGNDWIIFKSDKQKLEDGNVLENPYFQKQIKLMQYTGLKDKNGVEIYEGDIVKCSKLTYDNNQEFPPFIDVVEYFSYSFHLSIRRMLPLSYGETLEVIGNIHENPELLNN